MIAELSPRSNFRGFFLSFRSVLPHERGGLAVRNCVSKWISNRIVLLLASSNVPLSRLAHEGLLVLVVEAPNHHFFDFAAVS
jgi:hypothetical protein